MSSKNQNVIGNLRGKFDPHYKLASNVGDLEKKIPIQLAQLHKTLSKSFGMQRKTLIRVLALEERLAELEAEKVEVDKAIEEIDEAVDEIEDVVGGESDEEIPEELDGLIDDVRGQESEIGGDDTGSPSNVGVVDGKKKPLKKKPRKKKPKIKIKKKKISAKDIKKGTPLDNDFSSRVLGENEQGEYLSKKERIARFKGEKFDPKSVAPEDGSDGSDGSDGKDGAAEKVLRGLGGSISTIADTVDSIFNTLKEQFELQKDTKDENRVQKEQADAEKQEKKLEKGGIGKGMKDKTTKALQPFTSLWDKFVNFLTTLLFGKAVMKVVDWFADPENGEKIKSFVRFLKDWWPVLLASIMAFVPALLGPGGMILGTIVLLAWSIPKIIAAVKWLMDLPGQIVKFLKGGEKADAKLEQDALKEIDKEGEGLKNIDPETGDPLEKAKAEVGEETPPIDPSTLAAPPRPIEMNQGGEVPGTGDKDTVPAMLTPGEFVMSKGAVEKYGEDTLAGMNAAAGGTNIPTLQQDDEKKKKPNYMIPHFSGGGKQKSADDYGGKYSDLSGTGVVTDPKKKKEQEDYMLHWVNKERVEFLGLPPLKELTYAQGVELTEMMGPGPKTTETTDTHFDFDKMLKTTTRTKTRGDESISDTSIGILTEKDKQKYLESNPSARLAQDLQNQFEMGELGDSISANAKMNGGGLVPAFNGGGLVQGFSGGGFINNIPQVKAAKWLGSKLQRVGGKIANVAKAKISDVKKSIGITPPSSKTTVVVAPSSPGKSSELPRTDYMGSGDIPQFAARHPSSKAAKQKTLGITV